MWLGREENVMRRMLMLLPLLLAGAACKQQEPAKAPALTQRGSNPAVALSSAVPSTSASARESAAQVIAETNSLFDLAYTYPAPAAAISGVKAYLDADIDKQRSALAVSAKQGQAEAKQNGFEFRPYHRGADWQVVADMPGWLSLSANLDSYEGGAHPSHWFDALLWDKQAGKRREAADLFMSKQALSKAIRADFCRLLNKQRSEKRGEPVKAGGDGMFNECIDPVDQVVILGSSDKVAFNRIGILVAPYEAGPYAEGDYEVTLPVTPAVLAAVRPEYRSSFAVKR
jgi:Deacetylase PdaC/Protein of unknown function (DUF3298)